MKNGLLESKLLLSSFHFFIFFIYTVKVIFRLLLLKRINHIYSVDLNLTVCSFDRSLTNAPGPCVLFATPGMISGGFSLEVFNQWAPYEGNLIMLPGFELLSVIFPLLFLFFSGQGIISILRYIALLNQG